MSRLCETCHNGVHFYHMPSTHVHQCISVSHANSFIYLTDKLAVIGCSLYTELLCMKSVVFVDGCTELNYNVYRTNKSVFTKLWIINIR